ncbi:hypothetical protein V492_04197 [Pseudogymnoascus sp. VKM F-4246]|nr:hypothetical protein V492_04197 [Pseudogymnoascus sp. VKM F-4246]
MKLIRLALFATPFFTAVSAVAVPEPAAPAVEVKVKKDADAGSVEVRREFVEEGLQKRACTNNGCKCASGTKQGQYCGYCNAVTDKGSAAL